jgi:hypothetical protein
MSSRRQARTLRSSPHARPPCAGPWCARPRAAADSAARALGPFKPTAWPSPSRSAFAALVRVHPRSPRRPSMPRGHVAAPERGPCSILALVRGPNVPRGHVFRPERAARDLARAAVAFSRGNSCPMGTVATAGGRSEVAPGPSHREACPWGIKEQPIGWRLFGARRRVSEVAAPPEEDEDAGQRDHHRRDDHPELDDRLVAGQVHVHAPDRGDERQRQHRNRERRQDP